MKKSKPPTGPTCNATAGAFKCVLQGEHAIHSTSPEGRKARQYATWSTVEDGRIRVITYSSGKKMSEWFEDAPPARNEKLAEVGYCGAMFQGYARMEPCTLTAGHAGPHHNTSTDVREVEVDPRPLPSDFPEEDESDPTEDEVRSDEERNLAREQREAREAHARELEAATKASSLTDACTKCGRDLGEHDGKKCPKTPKVTKRSDGAFTAGPPPDGRPVAVHLDELAAKPASGLRILGYRRHRAAELFELLEGEELQALADSIKANGQREPIVLVAVGGETFILDGSNRGLACEMTGIKPRTVHYEGPKDMTSLVKYSMDKNRHRRHQDPSVLAMVAIDAAQLGRGNPGDRETGRSAGLMTQAEAGARLGISERLVRRAKVVRDKGTAKVNEAVRKGKMAVEAAEQVTRLPRAKQDEIADEALAKKKGAVKSGRVRALVKQEEKRGVVRKINEQRVEPAPLGPFGMIVIDPPWPYENSDQHDGSRGHIDYPPMSIDDICALRSDLDRRAKEDCILGLWITNAFVHEIGRVLEAWGFTHRTMITWDKDRAGVGTLPRGQTEHLVVAMRGEPVHTLNEVTTLLRVPRREHSRKPDEMYELLAKHCSGPRIDMFSREQREGWSAWGAEPKKFETEAA